MKLNELLETSNFQNRDLADVHQVRTLLYILITTVVMWIWNTFIIFLLKSCCTSFILELSQSVVNWFAILLLQGYGFILYSKLINTLYIPLFLMTMCSILFLFQDLNIPVPPPASAANEPNAKRPRVDSSEVSSNSTLHEGTRVYALPNGTVPCNKPLSDLIHLVKPHIRELVEDSNLVSCFFNTKLGMQ